MSLFAYHIRIPYLVTGDYDGDKVSLIWDPTLVDPFVNAPLKYGDTADDEFTEKNFKADNISAQDFMKKIADMPEVQQIREYQAHLLGAIQDTSVVGMYSNLHVNSTYHLGYRDPKTIRLAHM